MVPVLEEQLFPAFQIVLVEDVQVRDALRHTWPLPNKHSLATPDDQIVANDCSADLPSTASNFEFPWM